MDGDQVKATLNEFSIFDQPIVEHGFMPYNRDYRVVVDIAGQRSPGGPVQILERYTLLFRGCVAADYETKVTELDLNDVFVDYERWKAAGEPLGFVWGVNWADGYPGPTCLDGSGRAAEWTRLLGIPMHEVMIETNTYELSLVFAELTVRVEPGDSE